MRYLRFREFLILFYRLFLVYVFYFVARCLFLWFQKDQMGDISSELLLKILLRGIQFDTTALLYVNLLFIVLSILPLWVNTGKIFQKILFYLYFFTNGLAYATNFIDMVYYPFSKSRLTTASWAVMENEQQKGTFLFTFLMMYWYMVVLFVVLMAIWIFLYKKVKITPQKVEKTLKYISSSVIGLIIIGLGTIAGIRGGDLAVASRPINILDASRYVSLSAHADAILNTPFTLIRTIGKNKGFKSYHFVNQEYITENIHPIKQYSHSQKKRPNIVIFILESFGREYWGSMNSERNIPNFKSYTPFLDSLAQHGYVFDNAYCNGRQSIHGMSSILAGIPTFQVAYTSSPYVNQPTQSIVSVCNELGYETSFFHSAPNGSMGFLGFSNILGYHNYYGKTEYSNDADFDGIWGIWDEPFFQFMNATISEKKNPFMATIFTVSSHHPFKIPQQYEGKFEKGTLEIHQCIGYTDYSIKRFFESAKKEKWFEDTIFVFTADHPNMNASDLYHQPITSTGIPILFYSPNKERVGVGKSSEIAQQIDIYPTLAHLIGYEKPFRSWGRSLFSDKETPRAYISNTQYYQLMQGNYIYVMNTEGGISGIYDVKDEGLKKNILGIEENTEINKGINDLQAFMQDYMDRIIHKKLFFQE